jgi:hypothetical protein
MPGPVLVYRQPLDGHDALLRRLWAIRRRLLTALGLARAPRPTLYLVRQNRVIPIPPPPGGSRQRIRAMQAQLKTLYGQRVE